MTEIERLRAARDAAVARAEAARTVLIATGEAAATATKRAMEARAEGERRATAAIVADLRAMSALYSTGLPSALAARYETGAASPATTGQVMSDAIEWRPTND